MDFESLSSKVARLAGSPRSFALAVLLVIVWALCGPIFHYSETWQLVINTSTTIFTFLMLFVVQNTQLRDSNALHLKLDEIIRALTECENSILDAENMSQAELDEKIEEYKDLAATAQQEKQGLEQVKEKREEKKSPALRNTIEHWLQRNLAAH